MADSKEIKMQGRAVSRGIAVGNAVCVYGHKRQFLRRSLSQTEIGSEVDRFEQALADAIEDLEGEIPTFDNEPRLIVREILDGQLLILKDPSLAVRISTIISDDRVNAESAVHTAIEEVIARLQTSEDEHLREKALDLDDLAERIVSKLGLNSEAVMFPSDSIVVAKEIRPSNLMEFIERGAIGVVSELGGWTSHTSIIAREAGIPAVTGVANISKAFRDGQNLIVDGFSGEVFIDPTESTLAARSTTRVQQPVNFAIETSHGSGTFTLDGRKIKIRTNTNSVDSYLEASRLGAEGIGLFRSESLIAKYKRVPTEEEQFKEYAAMADAVGNEGVRIRTFDIDSDQFYDKTSSRTKNPALGLRAIRLAIAEPELLGTQIRALMRAAHGQKIGIVVPMVASADEVNVVRQVIEVESLNLSNSSVPFDKPSVGAMVEIPAAVMLSDHLADVSDFFCLGTNDLVQYLLAADRDNESVSDWFRTLHPAMLRAVKHVIEVIRQRNKPLVVCGEMAGSPFYVPVLIGLGAAELSMNPSSIVTVRRVISGIAYEETVSLVRDLDKLRTASEVENAVAAYAREKWPHLFASGFLDTEAA